MIAKGDTITVHRDPCKRDGETREATLFSIESDFGMKDCRNMRILWALVQYPPAWEHSLALIAEDGQ